MKRTGFVFSLYLSLSGLAYATAAEPSADDAAPAYGMKMPDGYRDWKLITVAREEGMNNDLRAILGNDLAVNSFRQAGQTVLPDGSIIVRIAWDYSPLLESAKVFGKAQSHVAGVPKNGVQFMMKDSKRYAATGGWAYAQFNDGKLADASLLATCFPCHQAVKERDYVFNRYAP